ncbi:MAG: dehydrogenase [Planctomycetes bacterium]|nr:dehydrogenase [Planctomycetota bacterium]
MTKTRREFLEESLLATAAAAAGVSVLPSAMAGAPPRKSPNDVVRIAVIGVRGRGRGHVGAFTNSKDAEVVAICDPDSAVIGASMRAAKNAKYYKDLRKMLEDDSIDAVSIATPNHWHSLAAIWSLQAGKHVYVEKPVSHNVFEGRRVVQAAEKYKKLCQHGTQSRSSRGTVDAIAWLQEGGLGKVKLARALCYKRRGSIGKVKGPQKPPETCDYDLWTGPAEMQPLMRKKLHYDWHWDYNTGNGDIGNQGVHQMDIAAWGLGVDRLPNSVSACGGRLGYDDDGNTANTQVATFDFGDRQLVFEVRGLKTKAYRGAHIGVVFHCENGYLVSSSYAKVHAFDHDGKIIKTFQGGGNHFQNFVDAVKANKKEMLNAEISKGHFSAALCHLGNIPYRLGRQQVLTTTNSPFGDDQAANESFLRFRTHLTENGVSESAQYAIGPRLKLDPKREHFIGEGAEVANAFITRPYRKAFRVPNDV